jgi:CheY-like chemotaxis protein
LFLHHLGYLLIAVYFSVYLCLNIVFIINNKAEAMTNQTYPNFAGKYILIVEDDVINYKLLDSYLSKTNAAIYWAKNGVEAIDISIKHELDLVLMDIRMPEMDGITATKLIRKFYPNLPIIAQTAFTSEDDIERIMKATINEYMSKPIDGPELLKILKKYLKE